MKLDPLDQSLPVAVCRVEGFFAGQGEEVVSLLNVHEVYHRLFHCFGNETSRDLLGNLVGLWLKGPHIAEEHASPVPATMDQIVMVDTTLLQSQSLKIALNCRTAELKLQCVKMADHECPPSPELVIEEDLQFLQLFYQRY
jgi:hypothetical protein